MRMVLTILFALLASIPAGGTVAVLLADLTRADETFILVFFAIAPAALLASAIFLFAAARGATTGAAKIMLGLIALTFVLLGGWEYLSAPATDTGLRGVALIGSIALTLAVIVLVQWLIFRGRERRRAL
jgi:hypothetical protein